MILESGFFDSVGEDRKYNAEDFSNLINGIVLDGIFPVFGGAFACSPDGANLKVKVAPGRAWFNGKWVLNPNIAELTHTAGGVIDRVDTVVIRVNLNDRTTSLVILEGTPSAPVLTKSGGIFEYPLCNVTIPKTSGVIGTITDRRGTNDCPYSMVNSSLQAINIDSLYSQWQTSFENWQEDEKHEFELWVDTIRDILDETAAGNLQNQIDLINQTRPKIIISSNTPPVENGVIWIKV